MLIEHDACTLFIASPLRRSAAGILATLIFRAPYPEACDIYCLLSSLPIRALGEFVHADDELRDASRGHSAFWLRAASLDFARLHGCCS